jgi:hypothetical protein
MESELLKVISESADLPFVVHVFPPDGSDAKISLSKLTRLCAVSVASLMVSKA